jgi:nitrate/nitrite transport system substrate-binding protein
LDAAFHAAFGSKAEAFFADTVRHHSSSRRRFLKNLAIGAALVTLANCRQPDRPQANSSPSEPTGATLEKKTLKIGFIPITCATPIISAAPLGFYEKYGLNVEVVKMPSWAAVRDSAIADELDAYHLIAPMPITMTLGLDSAAFPMKLVSISNMNGNAITVAMRHKDKVKGPADFKGFRIAIPYQHSTHNLLLRYYLATGGLDPDKDVQLDIVPLPDTVAQMAVGELDAMLIAEPFNQRIVAEGVGFIHLLSKELWTNHPCCIFGASQAWVEQHPKTFQAVTKAIVNATYYAKDQNHREELANLLAARQYLNQPVEVLKSIYTGKFEDGLGNALTVPDRIEFDPYPWKSSAYWIMTQLVRWNYMPTESAEYQSLSDQVLSTKLIRDLAVELGIEIPEQEMRDEKLKFDKFDYTNPSAYLENQIKTYGV